MKLQHALIALSLAAAFTSCRDKDKPEEVAPKATPYVLDIPASLPAAPPMPADNPLTVEGVELGRHLFYEKSLSVDNSMSCGTCHQQKFAFADNRAISPGVNGALGTRNAMSLANVMWEKELNWDGSAPSLEEQARTPLQAHFEMNQPLSQAVNKLKEKELYKELVWKAFGTRTIKEEHILKALAQFQRTLISGNSKFDNSYNGKLLAPDEVKGLALYNRHTENGIRGAECFHCHNSTGLFTKANPFFNNGLDATFADPGRGKVTGNIAEKGFFKAPTLRNIALTAPYMHDGRFQTLEEVLDHYSDHIKSQSPGLDVNLQLPETSPGVTGVQLTAQEKQQIIKFLHTLTDTTFINDTRFSKPFNE
ncbi:MAG: cytochrome-c peroxidase [Hymenobacteraceae bacterium]|nr:cytochrome-c peroxidase [Hymenobacteraceae bacterium]MDX5395728.1 cytochrome-c peroxidase [Hymenobacteraceae bacterium]MDX5442433.1 cytochrome-c peroxidase [Hymenobacteraceae bacterium]MDX5511780.1 cytochrome-c peroxidase [Hymenobacteraceae bacterium]